MDDSGQQINHDDETHRETAETAKLIQEHKFREIVYRGIDPTSTLRKQNLPIVWCNSIGMRITNELGLEVREMFEKKRGQITIFTEMQQVLHVQSIHTILRVVLNELIRDEQWLVRVGGSETVESETTGKTGD